MKRKPVWHLPVLVMLGALFAFSAYQVVGSHLWRAQAEDAAFSALSDAVSAHATEQPEASSAPETPSVEPATSPYQFLKEENPDFWGWLTIPGTKLDYPVMYIPRRSRSIICAVPLMEAAPSAVSPLWVRATVRMAGTSSYTGTT